MRYIVKLDLALEDTYELEPGECADAPEEEAVDRFCADHCLRGLGADVKAVGMTRRPYVEYVGYGPDYTDYYEEIEYGVDVTVEARAAAAFIVEAEDPDAACDEALEEFERLFPDSPAFDLVNDTVIAVE